MGTRMGQQRQATIGTERRLSVDSAGLPEYRNAEHYDEENSWSADDDFYLNLARETGGPVLDAACGTGRLARAMAEAGLDVTGIDITPEMLKRAGMLATGLDIEWVHGDVRSMQLGRRFRLITMTSHSFQHLLTDQDISAFLNRAHEHLLKDGWLAFETRNFAAKSFGGTEEPTLYNSFQDTQGRWIDYLIGARYDPQTGVEELTGVRLVRDTGEREVEGPSFLRYLSLDHLNGLLRQHGFTIERQYGNWAGDPPGIDQPEVISICRPV